MFSGDSLIWDQKHLLFLHLTEVNVFIAKHPIHHLRYAIVVTTIDNWTFACNGFSTNSNKKTKMLDL